MKVCRKCGKENGDAAFCGNCGAKLPVSGASNGKQLKRRENCSRQTGRKKKTILSLLAAAALVAAVALALGCFRDKSGAGEPELQADPTFSTVAPSPTEPKEPMQTEPKTTVPTKKIVEPTKQTEPVAIAVPAATKFQQVTNKMPISVDGGNLHTVVLLNDGTVMTLGDNAYGQRNTAGWRNITQISTFYNHTLGLTDSGTVVAAGANTQGQCDVSDWSDIVCIAAGSQHSVGVKRDGTVVAVGENSSGQCDVGNWENIKYVAANNTSTFGLTKDGRVLVCGTFQNNKLASWSDMVSISVSANHVIGVHADGTVSAVGADDQGQCDDLDKWRNVQQVAAGYGFTVGLRSTGGVRVQGCDSHNEHAAMQWLDVVCIGTGTEHIIGIQSDGTLVAKGSNDDGQCDVYLLNQAIQEASPNGGRKEATLSVEAAEAYLAVVENAAELVKAQKYYGMNGCLGDLDQDGQMELLMHENGADHTFSVYDYQDGVLFTRIKSRYIAPSEYSGVSVGVGIGYRNDTPVLVTRTDIGETASCGRSTCTYTVLDGKTLSVLDVFGYRYIRDKTERVFYISSIPVSKSEYLERTAPYDFFVNHFDPYDIIETRQTLSTLEDQLRVAAGMEPIHQDTERESKPSITFIRKFAKDSETGKYQEYAVISMKDGKGNAQWTYTTGKYPLGAECCISPAPDRNLYEDLDRFYFSENGTLVALDRKTGVVVWTNSDFSGLVTGFEVGTDGTLYFCGYNGPHFFAVDNMGKTLHRIQSFGDGYSQASMIYANDKNIRVYLEWGPDKKFNANFYDYTYNGPDYSAVSDYIRDYVFLVNPRDYSYTLSED